MSGKRLKKIEERLVRLENEVFGKSAKAKATRKSETQISAQVSFNMNALAFMNIYARRLKGPQKFTLLLAYITNGDASKQESKATLEKQWNKMKTVLNKFNPVHANRAKRRGWVDSPKHGIYKLTDSWKECLDTK